MWNCAWLYYSPFADDFGYYQMPFKYHKVSTNGLRVGDIICYQTGTHNLQFNNCLKVLRMNRKTVRVQPVNQWGMLDPHSVNPPYRIPMTDEWNVITKAYDNSMWRRMYANADPEN